MISQEGGQVTLRVPKAETPQVTARLLAEQPVDDLTVEDPPIEDVIEQVFASRARPSALPPDGKALLPSVSRSAANYNCQLLLPATMRYLDFYRSTMRIAILTQFQYRVANYFYMIGMIAEPVIYLVVWSTVASAAGRLGGRAIPPASSPLTTSSGRWCAT